MPLELQLFNSNIMHKTCHPTKPEFKNCIKSAIIYLFSQNSMSCIFRQRVIETNQIRTNQLRTKQSGQKGHIFLPKLEQTKFNSNKTQTKTSGKK